ncbi:putative 2-C-methyl-D-erythritol 2,4-cyclodiphosphate synthase [Medicago truncatula]|uniref:Putative 2-C-methyl-D-erythritol 2,4-cyclodiphosphate synthase n=1 Tax=Medicago truncatula TaxID=3880 RepID=A0A072U089_MEDTR|nr:hypothetical protein MTR_7g053480 [Medicago truncatula]RHN45756.1 putative 2-C-methyl-D-erythritol 2,4-cyclodiphosphate synthase [Medicago truncatula]
MAASSLTSSFYSFPFTTSPKSSHLIPFYCSFHLKHHTLHLKSPPSLFVSASRAATPTTLIKIDKSSISATPSEVLPFRVGHDFELHQLKHGYALMIEVVRVITKHYEERRDYCDSR